MTPERTEQQLDHLWVHICANRWQDARNDEEYPAPPDVAADVAVKEADGATQQVEKQSSVAARRGDISPASADQQLDELWTLVCASKYFRCRCEGMRMPDAAAAAVEEADTARMHVSRRPSVHARLAK
ncbi:hypothetical protein [Enhygromyxa salina]|uniref:hypothetical protein n=1 Tax=Enhygromyxa salina TaxID=215803 RepID=UPI0011B1EAAB|nr:hypothetical protein [Enhygromyxa salina]